MNALIKSKFSPRRGFALIAALFIVVMLGLCLALLAAAFSYELRMPSILQNHGQLQALLLSSGAALENRLLNGQKIMGDWSVNMPPQLSAAGGQINIDCENSTDDKLVARISASYTGLTTQQTLTFARNGKTWQLENINLQ
ncbi:MAG TPA: hypothetical protein VKJ65_14580 [Phycisphaerae bacterium]|nr:hypothetical protein [Phycisphaerae bacterium]